MTERRAEDACSALVHPRHGVFTLADQYAEYLKRWAVTVERHAQAVAQLETYAKEWKDASSQMRHETAERLHDLEATIESEWYTLKKMQEDGQILSMSAAYPRNHASEPARWDMRFTIVYRDVVAAHMETGSATVEALYPDQATFKKEEQRRFELLLEHTDIPIYVDDLKEWK